MEFKEILSYTKKWWWLVLTLAVGGGLAAYWLYDVLPNERPKTSWSANARFETPRDDLRVVSRGKNVLRVRVDVNTERHSVTSDDNAERAAHYFAVIENAINSGMFTSSEKSTPFGTPEYRQYMQDLEKLAGEPKSKQVDIYNPKTLNINIGETPLARVNFAAEPLSSMLISARARLKAIKVNAESVPQTRVVEISVAGATSESEARIWADALTLAAIRESFQRHIRSFEVQIAREENYRDARQRALTDKENEELETFAQDRLEAVERLNPLDPAIDIAAQARELGVKPIKIPDFNEVNADKQRLAYYGHLKRMIQTPTIVDGEPRNYGELVGAITSRVPWDTELLNELSDLSSRKAEFNAQKISPESLLAGVIKPDEELLAIEKERFEAMLALDDEHLLEIYQPNQGVIWNAQVATARNEMNAVNKNLEARLQGYTEEDMEVIRLRREKASALDAWRRSLEAAFVMKATMLQNQRTREETKLLKINESLATVESNLRHARLLRNRYNTVAGLYNEALSEIAGANNRILEENQKIAGYESDLNEQSAVLRADAFSSPGSATFTKSNRLSVSMIVGLIILIGSSVIIYVMMLARNKITSEYDIRRHVNLPVLAKMAKRPESEKSLLTISPRSAAAEAFSTLATQVRSYAKELSLRSILVTSAVKSEGKTDVTCNLAVALARKGLSVLVIDTDLHRPRVASFFGVTASLGLVQYAQAGEGQDIIDYVLPTYQGGPDLLLPGAEVQDPVRLLESDAFKAMLKQAEREYDIVLFDSPPVARVGDALIVGAETDATVLVCGASVVTFADAALAKRLLTNIQANLLGVVLNNATDISAREYYNYYSYGDRTRRRVRKVFD